MRYAWRALSFAACALLCCSASAQGWTYRTAVDSFDGVELRTAVVRADSVGGSMQIVHSSKGTRMILLNAGTPFDCFPSCDVRVKFDDSPPMVFAAVSSQVLSNRVALVDYQEFESRLLAAKSVIVRAPHVRHAPDLAFQITSKFDPAEWEAARAKQAKEERCKANAVSENYSVCMSRP
jgi:hypothetical protein